MPELIQTAASPAHYFMECVTRAIARHNFSFSENAQAYLTFVLERFAFSQEMEMNKTNENGSLDELPILHRIQLKIKSATNNRERFSINVELGDTALFMNSFRGGYLDRRLQDPKYCQNLGELGYLNAFDIANKTTGLRSTSTLYEELCRGFKDLTTIASEALEVQELPTEQNILTAIERYKRFKQGNQQLLETLAKYGIKFSEKN
ncbi:MAG: hypothetical protein ABIH76_07920 [Candidatus Bathyarchaeota archaeon]